MFPILREVGYIEKVIIQDLYTLVRSMGYVMYGFVFKTKLVDWRNFGLLICTPAYLWLTLLMHCRSRRISIIQSSQSPAMETEKAFEVPSGRTPLEMTYLEVSSWTQNSTSVPCIVLTEGAFTQNSSGCGYGSGPLSTTTTISISILFLLLVQTLEWGKRCMDSLGKFT